MSYPYFWSVSIKRLISFIFSLVLGISAQGQTSNDSLFQVFQAAVERYDTAVIDRTLLKVDGARAVEVIASKLEKTNKSETSTRAELSEYLAWSYNIQRKFSEADSIFRIARDLYKKSGNERAFHRIGVSLASVQTRQGIVDETVVILLDACNYLRAQNDTLRLIRALNTLGFSYLTMDDLVQEKAVRFEQLRLSQANKFCDDHLNIYRNLSVLYQNLKEYDSSEYYLNLFITEIEHCDLIQKDDYLGMGYVRLATVTELKDSLANVDSLRQLAISYFELSDNVFWKAFVYADRASHFLKKEQFQRAFELADSGYRYSIENDLVKERRDNLKYLFQAAEGIGNFELAYKYYREYEEISEKVTSADGKSAIEKFELQLASEKKEHELKLAAQKELARERNRRNIYIGIGILVILIAIALWSRLRFIRRAKKVIEKERDRSEELLLNILPQNIANELKAKGESEARNHDLVTILFTDFERFTETAEKLRPRQLVDELDHCFREFDRICEKFGIEKIKTIGDAYMSAGGIDDDSEDSVKRTVDAALEMAHFMRERDENRKALGEFYFEMRVGLHTGPVVAGIVGVKKFQYDIWGDTVNTASRMESNGAVGKVNISRSTYELLKDDTSYTFESRGKVAAKGKGEIDMYFVSHVESFKP